MVDLARTFNDLIRLETTLWNAVDARLKETNGLTLARFETMQVLQSDGPCRVLDIAERLNISWGGVSKIVDRVQAAGHCRRDPNPDDARSSLIALTPAGREMTTRAAATLHEELHRRLAANLTPNQLEDLSHTLTQLLAATRRES
ncbi:DNA-binding MarR family transcriptional regulator [Nakamurella sp. UYEF19]|uniref:MarR family winged helix-turn-helix transcriptional regulator n=1 Tax=Nakamurella sp. UYEF19 TaxID=1756392 RepID=UPI003396EDFA